MFRFGTALGLLIFLLVPSLASGTVITSDTVWSGEVSVEEDVLIAEGATLTVTAGTTVRVSSSESTKTDPEFMSPQTEIIVRGTLVVDGRKGSPVTFLLSNERNPAWAGIIIDGGNVLLRHCIIRDAETAVDAIRGSVSLSDSQLTKNRYGITVQGRDAAVRMKTTRVNENDYGIFLLRGATLQGTDNVVERNRKKDRYASDAKEYQSQGKEYRAVPRGTSRVYGDFALLGTTVWQGRIEVNGILRVPENSRLIVMPGTLVEFSRRDTDSDGIGENGLLIQGILIAKGTAESPIVFRSAENLRRMGDWDAINIMNSDKAQNLIEYCQIEDAYRGLHFHFSNVAVTDSVLRNNYRGIQFQESVVEIRGTYFYGNKSGLQARDSEVAFSGNVVHHNYSGINSFRNVLFFKGNSVVNNEREGLRVREGVSIVEGNLLDGNRFGLMVNDAVYGTFGRNVISHNLEAGVSLKSTDNIEVEGNVVQSNGMNGLNIQDAGAVIRHNLISDNGERGIGVLSFQGIITENNILGNGVYNLGLDGETDVPAPMNWWGKGDVKKAIFDKENDPARGRAEYLPVMQEPAVIPWPLKTLQSDAVWRGRVLVGESVSAAPGVALTISPGTGVLFSKGAGLMVRGKVIARGERESRITFSSLNGEGAGTWDEILLDHAEGSELSNCTFEHATWALHSHFTNLKVERCAFVDNHGGIRFTSGPIEVRHSLFKGNVVGIRAFRGSALITENDITENDIGIFVREKGGGLTITRNNLFGNREYNIRIGDFNDEDVNARENWWGDMLPAETIFDARNEAGIGVVRYEPYARQPFQTDSPGGPRQSEMLMKKREAEK